MKRTPSRQKRRTFGRGTLANHKKVQPTGTGHWAIRVFHRNGSGRRSPRFLLKCGCCDQKFEIYYSNEDLEINGVMGSIENWRQILLPLLKLKSRRHKVNQSTPRDRD